MAPDLNLRRLREAGVSIWLDTLSRELLNPGGLATATGNGWMRTCEAPPADTRLSSAWARVLRPQDRVGRFARLIAGEPGKHGPNKREEPLRP